VRTRLDLPVPDGRAYETVGGFVMAELGRVPRTGDEVRLPGALLRVERMEGRRVDRIRAVPVSLRPVAGRASVPAAAPVAVPEAASGAGPAPGPAHEPESVRAGGGAA